VKGLWLWLEGVVWQAVLVGEMLADVGHASSGSLACSDILGIAWFAFSR